MGRLEKLKRQAMLDANISLLKEQTAYERHLDKMYGEPNISMTDEAQVAKDAFCDKLEELCDEHGWDCDCDEVIKILKPKNIEDNPFGI